MGNEMGNNNVSGTQEQDNNKVEPENKSSEVFKASINSGDVKAENEPVASKKEEGFHEKLAGLSSEEPSGVSVAHVEKDSSYGKEQESPVVEATSRILEASLASTTADKTEVQVSDGSSKAPLILSSDSKEQEPQSRSSSGIGTTDNQTKKDLPIVTGKEVKSSPLDSEPSAQDSEYVEWVSTPVKPMEDGRKPEGSDEEVLGLSGPHQDIEQNEDKLERALDPSDISSIDSEVVMNKDDCPREEMESQKEAVDLSNPDEKMTGTTYGLEVGKPPMDADEKIGDTKVQIKTVVVTNSLESFQGGAPESGVILIIPTEDTKVVENETGGQDYCHSSVTLADHVSLEESQTVTIITENVGQVDSNDSKMSLGGNENIMDLGEEDELVIEVLTDIAAVKTNAEGKKGKEGDLDSPDSVMFTSCQTEPEENLVPTYPLSLDQFQDGKQKSTLLESEMQENLRSLILESSHESYSRTEDDPDSEFLTIETSVYHEAFDIPMEQSQLNKPAVDQVSSYDLLAPEVQRSNSTPTTLFYQVNMSKTDDLIVGNPVAEGEEPEALVEKQVIALETTDSQKLKSPLHSYLEEEDHMVEPPKQQERNIVNKTVAEEILNSVSSSSPPLKDKRKPKYSLFSNCICCTAVIQ